MQENIVSITGQKAFTNSIILSKGCDNRSHRQTIKLIRKYENELNTLGKLNFESSVNPAGEQTEYAILNEDQATFLITLFRNTPTVVAFKLALVKAFRKALDEINRLYANPPRNAILDDKRKAHHPMMTALIEMREKLGKETESHHYMCENKLCNAIVTGQFKTIDESTLPNEDVKLLALVRRRNQSLLDAEIPYDERKKRLTEYAIRQRTKLICG